MVAIFKTQYFQGLSLKNLTYGLLNDSIVKDSQSLRRR